MRTIEVKVFKFDELSDKAKEHALNKYCEEEYFAEHCEANEYEFTEDGELI